MKRIFFLSFLIINSFYINYCSAQWVPTSLNIGGAYRLHANNNILFASGNPSYPGQGGIYKTTDNGDNWVHTTLNYQIGVSSIVSIGNKIFVSCGTEGIYYTTDYGNNWILTSFNGGEARCLAVNGNNLFASSTYNGIFLSTNFGDNWIQTSVNYPIYINSLSFQGSYIYAGAATGAFYFSTNNGYNWTLTNYLIDGINAVATLGNSVFAGLNWYNGIYKSTNNGINWVQTTINNRYVLCLTVCNNYIFAGCDYDLSNTSGHVYLSRDTGLTWHRKNEGMGQRNVYDLEILNNYIFASMDYSPSVMRRNFSEITEINETQNITPADFKLSQNYPNPFNPTTNIRYQIPNNSHVILKVYDILGKEVATLVNEKLKPGEYETTFDCSGLASGIYFYTLSANGNRIDTKKMLMIK